MTKKYMIRCDIEGVSGVVSYEQAEPGKSEYEFGQRMFTADLLALIEGLRAGGADEIVIYDEHYYGRNIDISTLPEYATAICGKPPYRPDWAGGLDESFSGLALLGFHSKADTPGGLLPHSYELDIADLRINGVSVGEIGMEAAIAGDYGVPTVMVVGDSAGVEEAQALIPEVTGVVVKESVSEAGGICYPLSVTGSLIREAAETVARTGVFPKPLTVVDPVTLEIVLRSGAYLDAAAELLSSDMTDDCTMVLHGRTVTEVWASYWERKLRAQQYMLKKGQSQ